MSKDRWAHRCAALDLACQELGIETKYENRNVITPTYDANSSIDLLDLVYLHALRTIGMPGRLEWPRHEDSVAADKAIEPVYDAIIALSDLGPEGYADDKYADDTHLDRIVDGQHDRAVRFVIEQWDRIEALAAEYELREYTGSLQ